MAADHSAELQSGIVQAINIMLGDEREAAFQCTVVECCDESLGLYKLTYLDTEIFAYTTHTSDKYKEGDLVTVIAPKRDFNDTKYILNYVNPGDAEPGEEEVPVLDFDAYVNLTPDLFDVDTEDMIFGLRSYDSINAVDISDSVRDNNPETDQNRFINKIIDFVSGAKDRILQFNVEIKTNLTNEQIFSSGLYGISAVIPMTNGNDVEMRLDTSNMTGSPKTYLDWTRQTVTVKLDESMVYDSTRLPTVIIYKDGFIKDSNKVPADFDIQFRNPELYVVGKILQDQILGYTLIIKPEEELKFYEYDNPDSAKTLQSSLKFKNEEITTEERLEDEIYWFVLDPNITEESPEYVECGGTGWRCINSYTEEKEYDDEGNVIGKKKIYSKRQLTIDVRKIDITDSVNSYKCVEIHNGIPYLNIKDIYREDATRIIKVESLSGTEIDPLTETVKLRVSFYYKNITNNIDKIRKLCYTWIKEEWDGTPDGSFIDNVTFEDIDLEVDIPPYKLDEYGRTHLLSTITFPIEMIKNNFARVKCRVSIMGPVDGFGDFNEEQYYDLAEGKVDLSIKKGAISEVVGDISQAVPNVLFDYNVNNITVKKDKTQIANITCRLTKKAHVQGHLILNFIASEESKVILNFVDNNMDELFAPLKYNVHKGRNKIGVPHSYLHRLAGLHSFVITMQCTNGEITIPTRGVLFSIESGYLLDRVFDVSVDVLDLSVSQMDLAGLDEVWTIGIDEGKATLKSQVYENLYSPNWIDRYKFEDEVKDASIDFNGVWAMKENGAYSLLTDRWPMVALVLSDGTLNIYTYDEDTGEYSIQKMIDTNVKQVSICRGYSSEEYIDQDQGIVCAYVKNDNTVWYTHYSCNSILDNPVWYDVVHLDNLIDVYHVSVGRTNDYRMGICVSTKDDNKWYLTDRTYVGQAIRPEYTDDIVLQNNRSLFYIGPEVDLITSATQLILSEDEPKAPEILYGEYDGDLAYYSNNIDIKKFFKVYLDDKEYFDYDIYIYKNKLGVDLKKDTDGIKKIRIVFDNFERNIYINKSGQKHGWFADSYDFTWYPYVLHNIYDDDSYSDIILNTLTTINNIQILSKERANIEQLSDINLISETNISLHVIKEQEYEDNELSTAHLEAIPTVSIIFTQIGSSPI